MCKKSWAVRGIFSYFNFKMQVALQIAVPPMDCGPEQVA